MKYLKRLKYLLFLGLIPLGTFMLILCTIIAVLYLLCFGEEEFEVGDPN